MKILHIIAADSSPSMICRFQNMITAYKMIDIQQFVMMAANDEVEESLQTLGIPYEIQKFSGLFDLRSKKAVKARAQSFQPHIVQSHSTEAALFAAESGDGVHIAFLPNDEDDARVLGSCTAALNTGASKADNTKTNEKIISVPPLLLNGGNENATPLSRKDFNTPDDFHLIGAICAPGKKSGLDKIFQALRELTKTHLWVLMTEQDRESYTDLAAKIAVQDKTRFFSPENTEESSFIKSLDLLVITPGADSQKQTVSSWAAGTTPVYTGRYEDTIISNKENGLATGSDSALKIREDVMMLLEEQDLRENFAQSGKNLFKTKYKPEVVIGRYLKAYERALKL